MNLKAKYINPIFVVENLTLDTLAASANFLARCVGCTLLLVDFWSLDVASDVGLPLRRLLELGAGYKNASRAQA
jgi:hypothetical protein